MRALWEIFTVLVGIGIILAIAKGFPMFRAFLLHPLGLLFMGGMVVWVILFRKRRAARHQVQ